MGKTNRDNVGSNWALKPGLFKKAFIHEFTVSILVSFLTP